MITAKIIGALILGLPAVVVAWAVLWRRQRAVFFFALTLILIGLGYLMATGASDDIARTVVPGLVGTPVPAVKQSQ